MKPTLSDQKLRGGYYTPPAIATFLAAWAVQTASARVLEPACGDGNLLKAAVQALLDRGASPAQVACQLQGVEFDPLEADKACHRLHSSGISQPQIHIGDFFAYCREYLIGQLLLGTVVEKGRRFEAVISNPPFIRYQNFPEEHRDIAFSVMRQAGLHPNRLTNAWAPFLVAATLLLSERGRLAMIIPAELFQVSYAAEVRKFLSEFYHRITIVTFKKLVFDDIQQEVVLLLCERDTQGKAGIRVLELEDGAELASWGNREPDTALKPLDHSTEKWTQYFLDAKEIELLRTFRCHPKVILSGKVLDVDVGVVTGDNSFFALTQQQTEEKGLAKFTSRMVTRSSHLEGGVFTPEDWKANALRQYPSYLLQPPDLSKETLPADVLNYIDEGEQRGVNQGYKCRIRKRWYIVPSVWTPDAFMLRQVHGYPKLILNQAGATSTDTIHRVRFRGGVDGRVTTAAFLNSLTLAFSEVTGRSYGGGVLTFEPSEAEDLPMVIIGGEALDLDEIDRLLRTNSIEAALDVTDGVLLRDNLGLTGKEIQIIRGIWKKMRDRRIYRKR